MVRSNEEVVGRDEKVWESGRELLILVPSGLGNTP